MSRIVSVATLAIIAAALGFAADPPKLPAPQKEHHWLQQLEGNWTTETEAVMEPGKPPMKMNGTESTRSLGGFWTVSELKCDGMGMSVTGLMPSATTPRKASTSAPGSVPPMRPCSNTKAPLPATRSRWKPKGLTPRPARLSKCATSSK